MISLYKQDHMDVPHWCSYQTSVNVVQPSWAVCGHSVLDL